MIDPSTIKIYNMRYSMPSDKPYDVRVDRYSVLGNPYRMNSESERDEVIDKYKIWLDAKLVSDKDIRNEFIRLLDIYFQSGKLNLFCWCHPKRCHASVIKDKIVELLR